MKEAEKPIEAYPTLDALFTRRLTPGARTIRSDWVHPCDGILSANGKIRENQAFQIKGWTYPISTLLGQQTYGFDGGAFLTYYLCPTDYHRVHSPCDGEIVSVRHMQGQLWPVNEWSVRRVAQLFCLNERIVYNYHTPHGDLAVVMVGATNVGDIEVTFDHSFKTNLPKQMEPYVRNYNPGQKVKAGDEIGVFHMGSTVVVVASAEFARNYKEQGRHSVRLGDPVLL